MIGDQAAFESILTTMGKEEGHSGSAQAPHQTSAKRAVNPADREQHDQWDPPAIGGLRNLYASSIIEEFVRGHTTSDVLTELIQNEFDAEGDRLEVAFWHDSLQVTGRGKTINAEGWKRLAVVLGTGEIRSPDGTVDTVRPKANGIGSKNFGLRSLFLFGDRIYIRSGGKITVKDRFEGSPPRPISEPTSMNRRGVLIDVPYRNSSGWRLEPFTVERERDMLNMLLEDLQYTVLKLAQPQSKRNLSTVVVTSERCDRRITWTQSAKRVQVRQPSGVVAVERTVRMQDSTLGASERRRAKVLREIEFEKAIPRPTEHRDVEVPNYFLASRRRIRIGVSFRLERGRISLDRPGIFFYPLGLRHGFTGTAVSVKAPFILDQDRSRLLEDNAWNRWLLERAADLTIELLTGDWQVRFGADAYLALKTMSSPAHPAYAARISERLKKDACWPTRGKGARGRPILKPASQIVLAERPEFDDFLSPERYLHDTLVRGKPKEAIQTLASVHGAKLFGIDALIRLRCAGEDSKLLMTRLDSGQADCHYTNYETALRDVDRQRRFAAALEAVRPSLTDKHKTDLRRSPATLAADGTLRAPKDLHRFDLVLADACPVPSSHQLHSELLEFKAIADLCNPFDEAKWAADVAQRLRVGEADAAEQEALSRYVLSRRGQLRRTVIAAIRTAPILRDHRGEWVAPEDVMSPKTPGAWDLEPVLHFPQPEYAKDHELESRLRFRRRLTGRDLIAMAHFVALHSDRVEAFESVLRRRHKLLAGSDRETLAEIPFLRSSVGGLESPRHLYLKNHVTVACLGENAPFVAGLRVELYRTLGCSERPSATDIAEHLRRLAQEGHPLDHPEVVYPALVSALRAEKSEIYLYKSSRIIWTDFGYRSPEEVLVGPRFPKSLRAAVPHVLRPDQLVEALQALGAHTHPQEHHWSVLFNWFNGRYNRTGGPVTKADAAALQEAYQRLNSSGLPGEVGSDIRCLLGRDGRLYSYSDVTRGRFVINDDPDLADAITKQGAHLAFADITEMSREFFLSLDVPHLTAVIGEPKPRIGMRRNAPHWFKPVQQLEALHSQDFASGLAALGRARDTSTTSASVVARRLAGIAEIDFVENLELIYQVAGTAVRVGKEVWLGSDRVSLVRVGSHHELQQLLATGLARVLTADAKKQQEIADSIDSLLACADSLEMARFLRRRGIPWEPPSHDLVEYEDQEDTIENASGLDAIIRDLGRGILELPARKQPPLPAKDEPDGSGVAPQAPSSAPMPALDEVILLPRAVAASWEPSERLQDDTPGRCGSYRSPIPPSSTERDEAVGRRGEELVYRAEQVRVRKLGYDEDRVIWVAKDDRTADHDIRSVDEDGADLFIEVKSTVGTGGRFEWSVREFQKALQEGNRYVLVRVYEADTSEPTCKLFRAPISLVRSGQVKVDIAGFRAEVEPMDV